MVTTVFYWGIPDCSSFFFFGDVIELDGGTNAWLLIIEKGNGTLQSVCLCVRARVCVYLHLSKKM